MKLFLDACVIIYWIEAKTPFYSKLIRRLQELRKRHPDAVFAVSRLSHLECKVRPLQNGDERLLGLYEAFFSAPDLLTVEMRSAIVDHAAELRAKTGLRTPDAIQAASALSLGEPCLFLSSDASFRKVPHLQIEWV
ncbi:MAG: PIN domain-containing protein [Deltaproteobacteria bacterium]|nr:PIN domain-containing protein [Deltaproteobacteria bacterium]